MAELKDHRANMAPAVQDMSEAAARPAEVSAKLAKSDPEPAKIPADPSAPVAAAGPRLANTLPDPP